MKMQLTPINELGGWLFKREDLFQPFPFCKANGSKLRQSIILTEKNIETARNGLITGTVPRIGRSCRSSSVRPVEVPYWIFQLQTKELLLQGRLLQY